MVLVMKRKPFKHQTHGSTRSDYPVLSKATGEAKSKKDPKGVLFYERGFFGIVWFDEEGVRWVRDLKNW